MADVRCPSRLVAADGDLQCQIRASADPERRHYGDHVADGHRWPNPKRLRYAVGSGVCSQCRRPVREHAVDVARLSSCPLVWDPPTQIFDKPASENLKTEGVVSVKLEATARDAQVGGDHYRKFAIQPWDVIDEYGLDYYRGNVVKYVLRADHKGAKLEDLKKARQYLDRAIEIEEGKEGDEPKPAWP